MRKIPTKLRTVIASDPYYLKCARADSTCNGVLTWEHCWIYASNQINEVWAIIPLCWWHHLDVGLNKEINQWISINRATAEDLAKYARGQWSQIKMYLNGKYGDPPVEKVIRY